MSYSNQMIVHAVDTMESYLNNKLPETKLWEHSFIKKQIDRREYQENFTIEDHIRGMVYSMLSSGAKWDRVVDGIDDSTGKITPIDELFHNYNMEYILSSSSDFFTERIKEICGATQSTRKQGMLKMMGVFAELERNMISQRVKSGMENAKAKGKAIGRPVTTTDNIPSIFYHYYPQYKNKKINKSELARLCSLSIPTVYKYLKIIEGQD